MILTLRGGRILLCLPGLGYMAEGVVEGCLRLQEAPKVGLWRARRALKVSAGRGECQRRTRRLEVDGRAPGRLAERSGRCVAQSTARAHGRAYLKGWRSVCRGRSRVRRRYPGGSGLEREAEHVRTEPRVGGGQW